MNQIQRILAVIAIMLIFVVGGCPNDSESHDGEHSHGPGEHSHSHGEVSRDAHGRDGSEHHGEEGEESGTALALDATYDEVRHGARLILGYDAQSKSFRGTVENTTDQTLERVRVEVHLSNGKELGPTTPMDLAPGKTTNIQLMATGQDFTGWSTHAEVGSSEHSHGDGTGKHSHEGAGAHSHEHE